MKKRTDDCDRWVEDTQMFQRIAGTPVTPTEILVEDWNEMRRPGQRQRAAASIRSRLQVVARMAQSAGRARRQ
jgi:hypothetical protein